MFWSSLFISATRIYGKVPRIHPTFFQIHVQYIPNKHNRPHPMISLFTNRTWWTLCCFGTQNLNQIDNPFLMLRQQCSDLIVVMYGFSARWSLLSVSFVNWVWYLLVHIESQTSQRNVRYPPPAANSFQLFRGGDSSIHVILSWRMASKGEK